MATITALDTEKGTAVLTLREDEVKFLEETIAKQGRLATYLMVNVAEKEGK